MKSLIKGTIFAVITLLSSLVSAELVTKMEYYLVIEKDGAENIETTEDVVPGDILMYRIIVDNQNEEDILDVVIGGKIHPLTDFVPDSATLAKGEFVEYSIDNGSTWSEKPLVSVVVDGKEQLVPAAISEYTNIRWNVDFMAEDSKRIMEYRVKIKDK